MSIFFEEIRSEVKPLPQFGLGRYIHRDTRSLDYQVKTSTQKCRWWPFSKPEPVSVQSVQWDPVIPALDQGSLGSCTGNAAAHALATPAKGRAGWDRVIEATAVAIYQRATHIDTFRGVYPPNDTGSSGLAVAKVLREYGFLFGYLHAFTLPQVKVALQATPCLVGLAWRDAMYQPVDGWVAYEGSVVGGHEVLLTGWHEKGGYFTFRNSWGPQWGHNGDFHLDEVDFVKVLRDGGDVIVPVWEGV